MSTMRKNLMAKSQGITVAINKKSREERSNVPTGVFADDYNRLHDLTAEAFPDLNAFLPPRVDTYNGGAGTRWSHQGYAEIDTFAEQIYQLLAAQPD